MKPENRLCLWCQHLEQEEAHDWSEVTRDPANMGCSKGHWPYRIYGDMPQVDGYMYEKFCIAKTCPDFQLNANLVGVVKE